MDFLEHEKKREKRKNSEKNEVLKGIYGITSSGKYYFPGKISSGCFDGNGFIVEANKKKRDERFEDIYDCSVDCRFDPDGMYTGRPEDIYDKPVQDADDL
jgi:hypothetical protein